MKPPFKKVIIFISLFVSLFSLASLTIEKKLDVNKSIQSAKDHLTRGNFDKAESILVQVKKNYPATEFVCIANYYLALSKFKQNLYYEALYFIKRALDEQKLYPLSSFYHDNIPFLAGSTYYKLGLNEEAVLYFRLCIDNNGKTELKQQAYLKICELYYKLNNIPKALFYYSKIESRFLPTTEIKQYKIITSLLLWDKIDTSILGYSDPNVSCIAVDRDILYIGLWNGGLLKYNYLTAEHEFYSQGAIGSNDVRDIYIDTRFIYIGTQAGVAVLDKRSGALTEWDEFKDKKITSICGNAGFIYFGTLGEGVYYYDKKKGTLDLLKKNFISSISSIYCDGEQAVLIGTYSSRLYVYKNGSLKRLTGRKAPFKPVTGITRLDGKWWFSTHGQGIFSYTIDTGIFSRYTFDNNYFLCITASGDSLFAGSFGSGIYRFDSKQNRWNLYEISDMYISRDIQQLTLTGTTLFIGTLGEGVLIRKQVH